MLQDAADVEERREDEIREHDGQLRFVGLISIAIGAIILVVVYA